MIDRHQQELTQEQQPYQPQIFPVQYWFGGPGHGGQTENPQNGADGHSPPIQGLAEAKQRGQRKSAQQQQYVQRAGPVQGFPERGVAARDNRVIPVVVQSQLLHPDQTGECIGVHEVVVRITLKIIVAQQNDEPGRHGNIKKCLVRIRFGRI